MLVLSTFLIFVSLSVAAIPLGLRTNGQTPHIRRVPSTLPAGLPLPIPDLALTKAIPADAQQLIQSLPKPQILHSRFIMGADYASSSGPFLGKSTHKRQDTLSGVLGSSTLRADDLKEGIPPNLSPGSTST